MARKPLRHKAQAIEKYTFNGVTVLLELDDYFNHRLVVVDAQSLRIEGAWATFRSFSRLTIKTRVDEHVFIGCSNYWQSQFPPVFELINPGG